jgi:glyoxylase-like metal-dependent hydrolase (beta-lactamase superfamily II)
MNNPAIIVGAKGITLVDPGSSYYAGKNILKEAQLISTLPVVAVFNTHVHGDHWLGNQAIIEKYPNAKIYASKSMIDRAKEGEGEMWAGLLDKYTEGFTSDTIPVYPNNAVSHLDTIKVGSETFVIHTPFNPAHTNTDIMIEHVGSKTLFLGDNLLKGRLGNFDGTSDMHNNMAILEYAKDLNLTSYVPGHGLSGSAVKTVQPFLDYLTVIKTEALIGYDEDLADYEIKPSAHTKMTEFYDWVGYDEQLGKHIGKMLREIESRDL